MYTCHLFGYDEMYTEPRQNSYSSNKKLRRSLPRGKSFMSQHLIEKIQSYIEIEEVDRQFIQSAFKPGRYAKGEHFLLAGDVCREAAFVERGVFRFYINLEGEETTYYFSAENEFICDYPSFLRQTASERNNVTDMWFLNCCPKRPRCRPSSSLKIICRST